MSGQGTNSRARMVRWLWQGLWRDESVVLRSLLSNWPQDRPSGTSPGLLASRIVWSKDCSIARLLSSVRTSACIVMLRDEVLHRRVLPTGETARDSAKGWSWARSESFLGIYDYLKSPVFQYSSEQAYFRGIDKVYSQACAIRTVIVLLCLMNEEPSRVGAHHAAWRWQIWDM